MIRLDSVELHYPGSEPPDQTSVLLEAAHRALRVVEQHLGWKPDHLPIHLISDSEPMLDHGDRSWITALASDGIVRIRLADLDEREPQNLAVIVTHEVIHIAVDHLSAARAPAWLSEGLAVNLSQDLPQASERLLEKAVAQDAALPLELLARPFAALEERDLVRLAYAQAASLVSFLETKLGPGGMREFVSTLSETSILDALRTVQLTPYLLEREWLRWQRSRS